MRAAADIFLRGAPLLAEAFVDCLPLRIAAQRARAAAAILLRPSAEIPRRGVTLAFADWRISVSASSNLRICSKRRISA